VCNACSPKENWPSQERVCTGCATLAWDKQRMLEAYKCAREAIHDNTLARREEVHPAAAARERVLRRHRAEHQAAAQDPVHERLQPCVPVSARRPWKLVYASPPSTHTYEHTHTHTHTYTHTHTHTHTYTHTYTQAHTHSHTHTYTHTNTHTHTHNHTHTYTHTHQRRSLCSQSNPIGGSSGPLQTIRSATLGALPRLVSAKGVSSPTLQAYTDTQDYMLHRRPS
jgi:hypothetical protein